MTAACRYSKWSVKPSRWFVYDSMCCVGDVLIITPLCPFPNWNTAHHSLNSYVPHGLMYQHLSHHSPAVLMSFCPFLSSGVPYVPCREVTPLPLRDDVQRQWVIIQKMRSGFDQKLPQTSSILAVALLLLYAQWTLTI